VTRYNKDFVVKNGLVVEGAQGTIDGSVIVTEAALDTSLGDYVPLSEKGSADGIAELDSNANVLTTNAITFEGLVLDAYELVLDVVEPTADRTITLPNTSGTVVTTGNYDDAFPTQSGQSGKFLSTDGTTVSWSSSAGGSSVVVTDAFTSGDTIFVGTVTPSSPVTGDVWIDQSSVTGAITWGQLKALGGIASGG
jgi:hypothetical protein